MGTRLRYAGAAFGVLLLQTACGSAPPPKPVSAAVVDQYVEGDVGSQPVAGTAIEVRVIAIHSTIREVLVPCWMIVTRGLEASGHAELSLLIKREANEAADAFPRDAVTVLGDLARSVAAGRHLRTWQLLDVPRGFLGRPELAGVIVAPGDTPGYTAPRPPLSLIAITADELEVARRFGVGRVAGLLGLRYRHYPTGTWIERGRPPVATVGALQQSTLANVNSRVLLDEAAIWHEPARTGATEAAAGARASRLVVLQLNWSSAAALERALREAGPQGVVLVQAPPGGNTDVSIVWTAERRELAALGRPDRPPVRYAAVFLAFPQSPGEPGARLTEDGYVVQMTREQIAELRKALGKHRPFAITPTGDRHAFQIRWASCVVQVNAADAQSDRLPDCQADPSRAYVPDAE